MPDPEMMSVQMTVRPLIGGGEMGRRVRETDWSATPLGDFATWPQSLRSCLSLVLNAKGIAALCWGPEQWLLYNDACGAALGDRHPWGFGRPMPEVLTDIAPVLGPQVAEVLATGEGFAIDDMPMVMRRHGRDEETVWTYSFSPVQGETGGFAGVLLLATEITEQRANAHRLQESQDRFGALVKASSEALYSMNPDWTEMRALTGSGFLAETTAANPHWLDDYIHPDDQAAVLAAIGDAIEGHYPFRFEHRVRRADGSLGWTSSQAVPISDAEGVISEWFGAASDVTARREAEDNLRALTENLEHEVEQRTAERDRIWRNSRDMLGVADNQGIWLSVNPAWIRILGWQPEDIVGRTSEWMEHPDDRKKTRSEIGNLAEGRTTFEFENRFRTRHGDYRTLSWTAAPEGGLLYCVARDVTHERASAAALRLYANIVQSNDVPICAFDEDYLSIGVES